MDEVDLLEYVPTNEELFRMIGNLKTEIGYTKEAILLLDKHQKYLGELVLKIEQVMIGQDTILRKIDKRQKKHGALSIIDGEESRSPSGIILPKV